MTEDRNAYGFPSTPADPGILLRFPSDTLARDMRAALDMIGLTMDPHAEHIPGCGETVYRVSKRRASEEPIRCQLCAESGEKRVATVFEAGSALCAEHWMSRMEG